jgi:hypothetical protein
MFTVHDVKKLDLKHIIHETPKPDLDDIDELVSFTLRWEWHGVTAERLAYHYIAQMARVEEMREFFIDFFNKGVDLAGMHDEGCPEDDTCECHLVEQFNYAVRKDE